jgi:hypothetical protein
VFPRIKSQAAGRPAPLRCMCVFTLRHTAWWPYWLSIFCRDVFFRVYLWSVTKREYLLQFSCVGLFCPTCHTRAVTSVFVAASLNRLQKTVVRVVIIVLLQGYRFVIWVTFTAYGVTCWHHMYVGSRLNTVFMRGGCAMFPVVKAV